MILYKKKYKIPIFTSTLTIYFIDTLEDTFKKYGYDDWGKYDAVCIFPEFHKYELYFENYNIGIIVHEAKHIVNQIFKEFGIPLNVNEDETECILLQYIVNLIDKTIKDYDKIRNRTNT